MLDASVVINLNATGAAAAILTALPNPVIVTDVVQVELERGQERGRKDASALSALVEVGLMEVWPLGKPGLEHFEKLVLGPALDTLDDGEAATISCAIEQGGAALFDERKAARICESRFHNLLTASSLDLLVQADVAEALGQCALEESIFNALVKGRMRVPDRYLEWIVELIGLKKAKNCHSLPQSVRCPKKRRKV